MKKHPLFQFAIGLGLLLGLIFSLRPAPALAQASVPRFEPAECPFPIPLGETIQCGYLVVPEDPGRGEQSQIPGTERQGLLVPTIRIAVAIVRSHSPNPAPDPILFLSGGPGDRTVEFVPVFVSAFDPFLATRDMIFFDQRGVGFSQPALNCPELTPALIDRATGRDLALEEQLPPYLACRDRLLSQGVNLAAYNITENAADVNDLRLALGYPQVNLIGVSYGTILGQTVMRDFPEGIRSVILDSVVPLQVSWPADGAANLSRMLKTIFANCAADGVCRIVYPDLETVFYQLLDRLNRAPIALSAVNPITGESYTVPFDGVGLIGMVMQTDPGRRRG